MGVPLTAIAFYIFTFYSQAWWPSVTLCDRNLVHND